MSRFDLFVYIIELISTISFSLSGSITAIRKGLDTFGVVIIGVITATGGGIIRDLVLGITPPKTFINPTYAVVAAATSLITFTVMYHHAKGKGGTFHPHRLAEILLFWLDTAGISIFTVVGIATAYEVSDAYNGYLLGFVGVVTGVGGGLLRDVLVGNRPYIFVKHFYACACIIGSIVCISLWELSGRIIAMLTGAAVITILRLFAARFHWNMPRLPEE